jgi:hypothetical protein
MPKVEMDVSTTVAPDRVRAALIDFSARRPEIWPGITPKQYQVFSVGETEAEVREGTRSFWAREHYDWSDPQTVRWTVKESNFNAPGSFVQATILPRDGGGSNIHIVWSRTPTSLLGRIAALAIRMTGGGPVKSSFKKGLVKLERASGACA